MLKSSFLYGVLLLAAGMSSTAAMEERWPDHTPRRTQPETTATPDERRQI